MTTVPCAHYFTMSGQSLTGRQEDRIPHLQFMAQSVPPPHIVTVLGKSTRPRTGEGQT